MEFIVNLTQLEVGMVNSRELEDVIKQYITRTSIHISHVGLFTYPAPQTGVSYVCYSYYPTQSQEPLPTPTPVT